MLRIHNLLIVAGFNAVIADDQAVYSRGASACIVYFTDAPREPDWLLFQDNKVREGSGAAQLAPLIAHAGREAA